MNYKLMKQNLRISLNQNELIIVTNVLKKIHKDKILTLQDTHKLFFKKNCKRITSCSLKKSMIFNKRFYKKNIVFMNFFLPKMKFARRKAEGLPKLDVLIRIQIPNWKKLNWYEKISNIRTSDKIIVILLYFLFITSKVYKAFSVLYAMKDWFPRVNPFSSRVLNFIYIVTSPSVNFLRIFFPTAYRIDISPVLLMQITQQIVEVTFYFLRIYLLKANLGVLYRKNPDLFFLKLNESNFQSLDLLLKQ